jgi:hypothetical protein
VLLLHRHLPAEDVMAGIQATLTAGSTDPALVAIQARRLTDTPPAQVVPITRALGRDDRPTPTLAGYDSLLDHPAGATVIPLGIRP